MSEKLRMATATLPTRSTAAEILAEIRRLWIARQHLPWSETGTSSGSRRSQSPVCLQLDAEIAALSAQYKAITQS